MSTVTSTKEAGELLARLVACPSVNPAHVPPAGPPFGEGPLVDLLADLVGGWGAETQKVEVSPGRFNFIARFPGTGPRSLMLEAHADTVAIDGMTIEPFNPVVRDGKLYGRGSCDDKGPMAAMLLAIRSMLDSGRRPPSTLYFVTTCDEELGSFGAHHLMAGGFRPDAAVVGEPTDMAIVHAHKGAYRFRLTTHGRAAHSSNPSMGASAISPMAAIIQALDAGLAPAMKAQAHPLLGPPTVSIGTIRGGSQVNIVPARCDIEVDCRVLPGETSEGVASQVRAMVDGILKADARLSYGLEDLEWYPAFEQDLAAPIVAATREACRRTLGSDHLAAVPWASNAGVFHAAGVPSVLFGPGSIRQAHTADEHIALDEVVRAAAVYAEIIRTFA